jgi:ABC-type amino acid transport substrate-binding protein
MTTSRLASLRPAGAASLALATALALAACSSSDPTLTPLPSLGSAAPSASATAVPTPAPTPTPEPTPRFTNEADDELAGLIPSEANGVPVVVAPFDEFALTPGDIGLAYGEIGARFASLALAYVEQPRATLYAMRLEGEPVSTEELEPHLATAGRYVGIAGLDPEPWALAEAGGHQVWVRPEDNATAAGTMIYTWSSGEFIFLLIGVDDALNRAIVAALPGEPAPSPTPVPSATDASGEPSPSASPGD